MSGPVMVTSFYGACGLEIVTVFCDVNVDL